MGGRNVQDKPDTRHNDMVQPQIETMLLPQHPHRQICMTPNSCQVRETDNLG